MTCPHLTKTIVEVHLAEAAGRRLIGLVNYCVKGEHPIGDVLRQPGCPKDFNGTSWALMVEHHSHAPYCFKRGKGDIIVPETMSDEEQAPQPEIEEVPFGGESND